MKRILILLLSISCFHTFAQIDSLAVKEIIAFQNKLNDEYKNREESPLDPEDFEEFQGHPFFPIDLSYRVVAKLNVTAGSLFFSMKTTTSRLRTERIYGYVTFTLKGQEFRLPVYQSKNLMETAEYADYLFFPFSDETNGKQTYGGGRYIDLRIPKEGDSLVIDFNMAYNPYCAYSGRFSCPLVPAENQIGIEIPVGVMYEEKKKTGSSFPGISDLNAPEIAPEFPGGYEALFKFVGKHLKYPKSAVRDKISGTVYVEFVIEKDGTVSDVKTVTGISDDCNKEAQRVISLMPKWKPAQIHGDDAPVRMVLPIKFRGKSKWKNG